MKVLLTLCATAVLVAGCGSGSSSPEVTAVQPAAPVASKVSFTEFVREAIRQMPNDEPLTVDESGLIWDADGNPAAFDDLIGVDGG